MPRSLQGERLPSAWGSRTLSSPEVLPRGSLAGNQVEPGASSSGLLLSVVSLSSSPPPFPGTASPSACLFILLALVSCSSSAYPQPISPGALPDGLHPTGLNPRCQVIRSAPGCPWRAMLSPVQSVPSGGCGQDHCSYKGTRVWQRLNDMGTLHDAFWKTGGGA